MKLLVAYIRPEKLQNVKAELYAKGIYTLSVTNTLGSGRQKGYTEMYRGVTTQVTLLKKMRIEICLAPDLVDIAMDAIIRGARTEHEGDGVMYVLNVDQAVRIRTGETLK